MDAGDRIFVESQRAVGRSYLEYWLNAKAIKDIHEYIFNWAIPAGDPVLDVAVNIKHAVNGSVPRFRI